MKRIGNIIALLIGFSGGICGIVALCVKEPRQIGDFDYLGLLVGILSLLVLFTVGWQIYTIIDTKSIMKEMEKDIKETIYKQNEIIQKISQKQDSLNDVLETRVADAVTILFAQIGLALRFYADRRGSIQFYLNSIASFDQGSKDENAKTAFDISVKHLKEIKREMEEEEKIKCQKYKIAFPPNEINLFQKIILRTHDPELIKWVLNFISTDSEI